MNIAPVLGAVDALPFAARTNGGRYFTQADGEDLCMWVDDISSTSQVRLARLRRNALPQSEDAGRLSPIRLATGAALYEAVHLVFLPGNIIGAEFNFYGPRPSRLPSYLEAVCGSLPTPFAMEQILRDDAVAQLERQQGLRLVDLWIRRSYASTIASTAGSLGAALTATAAVGNAAIIGVHLQAEPHKRSDRLSNRLLAPVRRLARRPDLRENTRAFKVKGVGPEGAVEPIDLLSDALVSVRQIARIAPNSRAVDPGSAYAAVSAAYQEALTQQLLDGPGISRAPGPQ